MQTNREWLQELASNDVHALNEWFDAERVDTDGLQSDYELLLDANARLQTSLAKAACKAEDMQRENGELQRFHDRAVGIAADLCRACGFQMVDAAGEVVE